MSANLLDPEDEFRSAFENAPDVAYTHDLTGTLACVNRAFEEATGHTRHEAVGRNILDFVTPHQRQGVSQRLLGLAGGVSCAAFPVELVAKDGSVLALEATIRLTFRGGKPAGVQGFARTFREGRWSRSLRILHRLSTTEYEHEDDLLSAYLLAGLEIFEADAAEIRHLERHRLTVRKTEGAFGEDNLAEQLLRTRETIASGDPFYLGSPILLEGEPIGTIAFRAQSSRAVHGQAHEVIELMAKSIGVAIHHRQLSQQLAYQTMHDALTGLPNRLLLQDRLDAALTDAARTGAEVAVAFIDLDRFKQINDTLGHFIGDGVLQEIAQRLLHCVGGDTLARMGGDEFAALFTGISSHAEAVERAKVMLAAVRAPCRVLQYELFVTASVGLSFFPQDGTEPARLLRNADSAMYVAKAQGNNDVHCFQPEGEAGAQRRLAVETQLRRALDREELRMLYQPQVELNGKLAGLEVLLTWDHPELGKISPAQFIPIAEDTGMILDIGAWVLRESCRQMASWRGRGHVGISIGVNVSALQFTQSNFVRMVDDVLRGTGLPAELLELEVTESLVMRDVQQSCKLLRELRELGVRISLDDFGTGYSSLSYLKRLPANTLKIDQSFLRESEFGDATFALVQTMTVLGHTFGMLVMAEGVETQGQLDLIRRAGCDRAQGHLFGMPLERGETEKLMLRKE
ncbi:MAG: EAL domain-containing protein [Bryobacteraceae bacterium]